MEGFSEFFIRASGGKKELWEVGARNGIGNAKAHSKALDKYGTC